MFESWFQVLNILPQNNQINTFETLHDLHDIKYSKTKIITKKVAYLLQKIAYLLFVYKLKPFPSGHMDIFQVNDKTTSKTVYPLEKVVYPP